MKNAAKALIGLAALGFDLAVVTAFIGDIAGISPEGFSRACTNLALLAIAVSVTPNGGASSAGRMG